MGWHLISIFLPLLLKGIPGGGAPNLKVSIKNAQGTLSERSGVLAYLQGGGGGGGRNIYKLTEKIQESNWLYIEQKIQ